MPLLRHGTARRWNVLFDNGQRLVLSAKSVYVDPETGTLILSDDSGNLVTAFSRDAWMQVTPV